MVAHVTMVAKLAVGLNLLSMGWNVVLGSGMDTTLILSVFLAFPAQLKHQLPQCPAAFAYLWSSLCVELMDRLIQTFAGQVVRVLL